jgi:hypothetical protein
MEKRTKTDKTKDAALIGGGLLFAWWLLSSAKNSGDDSAPGAGGIVSKYYTIKDVQASNVAAAKGISEQFGPLNAETIKNVNLFIRNVLDPLTTILGHKLDIESWWRSPRLNAAVGGVPGSFHEKGEAIDADAINSSGVIDNRRLVKAMFKYQIPFTEMIIYGSVSKPTQIHLAFDPARPNEKEFLLKVGDTYNTLNVASVMQQYGAVEV